MLNASLLYKDILLHSTTLFLFLTLSLSISAQSVDVEIDSLKTKLTTQKDTHRIQQLLEIAKLYKEGDSAVAYAQQSIDLAIELNDKNWLADAYYRMGQINRRISQYSTAVNYFKQSQAAAEKIGNTPKMLDALMEVAHCMNMKGESQPSLQQWLKGLHISDSLNLPKYKADILFGIGDYFRLHHNVNASIEYLNKAEEMYKVAEQPMAICKVLFIKGSTYKISKDTADWDRAIDSYMELIEGPCFEDLSKLRQAKLYNNLGSTYTFIFRFEEAEHYLMKALKLKKMVGNKASLAYTLNELASLHYFQKNYKAANQYAEEAYELARQGEDIYLTYNILEALAVSNGEAENYREAYRYLSESYTLLDSIQNFKRIQAIAELELKYETSKKEQEIANRDLQLELQQNRSRNLVLLAILLLFILTAIFFWYRHRLRLKEVEAQQLQQLDQMKSSYFTNISHELRTPLSLIIDPIRQLQATITLPEQQQLLDSANQNAQRISKLINQMLDLDKLEARQMQLQYQSADLVVALSGMVASFQHYANRKAIQLQFVSELDTLEVWYDQDALEKIISNLLSNAFKFTSEKGAITILLLQRENVAEIIVKDSGIGITPDQLPHVFDRFYQADNSDTRSYEGTGIGLALAKELAELHQGSLHVKSQVGKGSSFILQLPLGNRHVKIEHISATPAFTKGPIAVVGDQMLKEEWTISIDNGEKGAVILLIEDQEDLRRYIASQLSADFKILEASNGREGIAIALEHIPTLIICDVMMPEIDGLEVCRQLKANELSSHIPIILLSAKARQEDRLEGLNLYADDYMTKPFDSKELHMRVRNLIRQRKLLSQQFNKTSTKLRPKDITVDSVDEVFLQQLLDAIETHMADDSFGVEQLSKEAGMSRSQLHRKLKALTGQSPSHFLRNIRLQRAYQLLEQEAGTASEIAYKVGFSNSNYFFKCFKAQFDLTPGQVLKGEKVTEG